MMRHMSEDAALPLAGMESGDREADERPGKLKDKDKEKDEKKERKTKKAPAGPKQVGQCGG